MAPSRIAIIDDEPGQQLGSQIKAILQRERGYVVDLILDPLPELADLTSPPLNLIIAVLPPSTQRTKQLLGTLRAKAADTPFLRVRRSADLPQIFDGVLWRPHDFLLTPLQAAEVRARVRRLLPAGEGQRRAAAHEPFADGGGLGQLVGEDPAFVAVKRKVPHLARSEVPVLLIGETGTGKELCARAVHYLSRRVGKPFLPVNCGAIPVELFERELFGHQKGAFTGAWAAQPGLIAEAEGGTLFLDEVEALSLSAQVKLLRFLEDQTYHVLGSPRPKRADVRILAATNVAVAQRVQDGSFRQDLFYRLAVLTLALPPLRQRPADIPLLVAHFWARYANGPRGETRRLSPRAMEALCQYAWPGNIRELQNVIQQVFLSTDAETIEPEDLPISPPGPSRESPGAPFKQAKGQAIAQFESAYLTELLRVHQGNVTQAARAAGKERRAFGRLIKKYHLANRLPSLALLSSLPRIFLSGLATP